MPDFVIAHPYLTYVATFISMFFMVMGWCLVRVGAGSDALSNALLEAEERDAYYAEMYPATLTDEELEEIRVCNWR